MDNTTYILMFLLFSGQSLHCFNLHRRSEEHTWGLDMTKDEPEAFHYNHGFEVF